MNHAPPFVDLGSLPENDRIRVLRSALAGGMTIVFFVSTPRDATRYLRKLGAAVAVVEFNGPDPSGQMPGIIVKVTWPHKGKVH